MGRTPNPITVTVRAVDGSPIAFGFIIAVTTTGARIRASVPLAVGAKFRFRIFNRDPPRVTERIGEVLGTEKNATPCGNRVDRCEVEWLSERAASELRSRPQ